MRKILGSLALLAALCLPAAAAETVLCRVSGYPAPTTCNATSIAWNVATCGTWDRNCWRGYLRRSGRSPASTAA